ncbi:MAG TPA: hypothetical protein VMS76_20465 [Planctomycetota bacterium]|nr:hypothetical protein [Planctomycetota bacterium]
MQGRLSLKSGILYVGRHELTAHVRPYDLDGAPLGPGFSFRGPQGEPSALAGLDVDEDHRIWLADSVLRRVRTFSLFGREVGSWGGSREPREDARGVLRDVADLALVAGEAEPAVIVACGGWRRHAVQVFRPDGRWAASLRPAGDPLGRFHGVRSVAARGRLAWVCEARAGRVQVFRDGEFHYLFSVPAAGGARFEPVALAPLASGQLVVACGGPHSALLLLDAGGRLVRVLAERGAETGRVLEPGDVVAQDQEDERARVAVVDRDAERVQVFELSGRCFGAIEALPGQAL